MKKPKFKMTKEEMLVFNDACDNAACQCPQYRARSLAASDRDILMGKITPSRLVKNWKRSEILWEHRYCLHLPEAVMEVFYTYKIYKARKRLWRENQLNQHSTKP